MFVHKSGYIEKKSTTLPGVKKCNMILYPVLWLLLKNWNYQLILRSLQLNTTLILRAALIISSYSLLFWTSWMPLLFNRVKYRMENVDQEERRRIHFAYSVFALGTPAALFIRGFFRGWRHRRDHQTTRLGLQFRGFLVGSIYPSISFCGVNIDWQTS